jgi:luxR family transcriptional regulator, regulator of transport and utilization of aryl beta-glucosides
MITILIQENETLYAFGIQRFMQKIFQQRYDEECLFIEGMTAENIQLADIIVLSLCVGEARVCYPELISRKSGVIFGIGHSETLTEVRLPSCFSDMAFIPRSAPLMQIEKIITSKWDEHFKSIKIAPAAYCTQCSHRVLSQQQMRIMAEIYKGKTPKTIAAELQITDKTVFSHKYQVMSKFGLRTDFELLRFLQTLLEKSYQTHDFRGFVFSELSIRRDAAAV